MTPEEETELLRNERQKTLNDMAEHLSRKFIEQSIRLQELWIWSDIAISRAQKIKKTHLDGSTDDRINLSE